MTAHGRVLGPGPAGDATEGDRLGGMQANHEFGTVPGVLPLNQHPGTTQQVKPISQTAQKLAAAHNGAVKRLIKASQRRVRAPGSPRKAQGALRRRRQPGASRARMRGGPIHPSPAASLLALRLCCPAASSERQHRARIEGQAV